MTLTSGYYDASATQNTNKGTDAFITAPTLATSAAETDGVYQLAYVVNGTRVDLFINGVYTYGFNSSSADASIKDGTMLLMWAEKSTAYIDNVTISIPNTAIAANAETTTLPERTAKYTQKFNDAGTVNTLKTTYGVSQVPNVTGADVPMEVNNGALQILGNEWGLNWFVLADKDAVKATDGVLVLETNLAINAHGTLNFSINNTALATTSNDLYTGLKANGFVAQFQSATETGYNVRYQYSTGSALTAGTSVEVALDKTNINLRVVANGNKYSIYIDDNFVASYEYDAAAEGKKVNENTNIFLWAQNPADVSIKDIAVYTAK